MIRQAIEKPEINFWVSLIIPIIGIAVSWGVLATRVEHVEEMVIGLQSKQQRQIEAQMVVNEEIKIRLAEIQKDIIYVRALLDDQR